MTQTLIEQLEALLRYSADGPSFVLDSDLRAIIEQHKQADYCNTCKGSGEIGGQVSYGMNEYGYETVDCPDCKGTREPVNIVAELVKALEDDAYAASFQSMAGYRNALIAKVKGMMG